MPLIPSYSLTLRYIWTTPLRSENGQIQKKIQIPNGSRSELGTFAHRTADSSRGAPIQDGPAHCAGRAKGVRAEGPRRSAHGRNRPRRGRQQSPAVLLFSQQGRAASLRARNDDRANFRADGIDGGALDGPSRTRPRIGEPDL